MGSPSCHHHSVLLCGCAGQLVPHNLMYVSAASHTGADQQLWWLFVLTFRADSGPRPPLCPWLPRHGPWHSEMAPLLAAPAVTRSAVTPRPPLRDLHLLKWKYQPAALSWTVAAREHPCPFQHYPARSSLAAALAGAALRPNTAVTLVAATPSPPPPPCHGTQPPRPAATAPQAEKGRGTSFRLPKPSRARRRRPSHYNSRRALWRERGARTGARAACREP